jgi:glycerol kinase
MGAADEASATLVGSQAARFPVGRLPTGTGKLPVLPNQAGAVTALAWVWQGQPTYASEGLINFSAATIEWLKNQLGLIPSASEVEKLATRVPDNGGVYLVPTFAGLSAPYWSPDARAAILGMTAHTRREHIVRAALESIAYQVRDVLEMMQGGHDHTLQSVEVDGGPTRNRFLMQFTADITGVELHVSEVAESSAWGAAMSALLGLGLCKSLDGLSALPRKTRSFRPQMDRANVKRLHDGWLAAVKRVL